MFPFRQKTRAGLAPVAPSPGPPGPKERGPACVLYLGQVAIQIPAIKELMEGQITTYTIAKIFDTLNRSAVVPPAPWPQIPHKFDSLIYLPSRQLDALHQVPACVFYPI